MHEHLEFCNVDVDNFVRAVAMSICLNTSTLWFTTNGDTYGHGYGYGFVEEKWSMYRIDWSLSESSESMSSLSSTSTSISSPLSNNERRKKKNELQIEFKNVNSSKDDTATEWIRQSTTAAQSQKVEMFEIIDHVNAFWNTTILHFPPNDKLSLSKND